MLRTVLTATAMVAAILTSIVTTATPAQATPVPSTWLANQSGNGIDHNVGQEVPGTTAWYAQGGPEGYLITGPRANGLNGRLKIEWQMQTDDIVGQWAGDNQMLAIVSVMDDRNDVVASSYIHRRTFKQNQVSQPISLTFVANPDRLYSWMVYYKPVAMLRVNSMTLTADTDAPQHTWEAESLTWHNTGVASGDGWEAQKGVHSPGWLSYGPYATNLDGTYRAVFQLKTDQVTTDNLKLGTIQVNEWTGNTNVILATRDIYRRDFLQGQLYQDFGLNFVATPGQQVEMAVSWTGNGYVKQNHVRVHLASPWTAFETESNETWSPTGLTQGEGVVGRQGIDSPGYIAIGPDSTSLSGEGLAVYTLKIDNNVGTDNVAIVSVSNPVTGTFLASRTIKRNEFKAIGLYQDFRLRYSSPSGLTNPVALNVNWLGNSTLKVNRTRVEDIVTPGNPRFSTAWNFPGSYKVLPDSENQTPGRPDGEITQSNLTTGVTQTPTTFTVVNGSEFPDTALNGPFTAVLAPLGGPVEVVTVLTHTPASSNTFTVGGRLGSMSFPANTPVQLGSNLRRNMSISSVVSNGSLYYAYLQHTEWFWNAVDGKYQFGARGVGLAISSDGGKTFMPYNGGRAVFSPGPAGTYDDTYASVAHVVRTGDGFAMVYEAYNGSSPQTIGYATSPDGINWTRGAAPAVLPNPDPRAWDAALSSPSVNYWGGSYYVWYTAAATSSDPDIDPEKDSQGYAAGTSLAALTKNGPPVFGGTGLATWDSKTVGKATVHYDGQAYFMVYEGGNTNQCTGPSLPRWGIGIARSTNLATWTRYSANPIFRAPPGTTAGAGCQMQAANGDMIGGRQVISFWDGHDNFASIRQL